MIVRANISTNIVDVSLDGANKTADFALSIRPSGNNQTSLSLNNSSQLSTGIRTYSLRRLDLSPGEYGLVQAQWGDVSLNVPVAFNAIGPTRYSTYNTPDSNHPTCSGPTQPAVLVDFVTTQQACHYEVVNLSSTFATQVRLNGSGVNAGTTIIPLSSSWMSNQCVFPPNLGVAPGNIFVRNVPPKTGSCNTTLGAGISLAVSPGPTKPNSPWTCGQNVLLVDPITTNTNSIRVVQDECPACAGSFGGQLAHIDVYNSSGACNGLVDTGNFFSIQLR